MHERAELNERSSESLMRHLLVEAVADLDRPYVVISMQEDGTALMCRGPYPSALEALTALDQERRAAPVEGCQQTWFEIAPLFRA